MARMKAEEHQPYKGWEPVARIDCPPLEHLQVVASDATPNSVAVYINGEQAMNVTGLKLDLRPGDLNRAVIEFMPGALEIEGDLPITRKSFPTPSRWQRARQWLKRLAT